MMETLFVAYKTNQCEKIPYYEMKQSLRKQYDVFNSYDEKKHRLGLVLTSSNI